jgi:hypothetical protein
MKVRRLIATIFILTLTALSSPIAFKASAQEPCLSAFGCGTDPTAPPGSGNIGPGGLDDFSKKNRPKDQRRVEQCMAACEARLMLDSNRCDGNPDPTGAGVLADECKAMAHSRYQQCVRQCV